MHRAIHRFFSGIGTLGVVLLFIGRRLASLFSATVVSRTTREPADFWVRRSA